MVVAVAVAVMLVVVVVLVSKWQDFCLFIAVVFTNGLQFLMQFLVLATRVCIDEMMIGK